MRRDFAPWIRSRNNPNYPRRPVRTKAKLHTVAGQHMKTIGTESGRVKAHFRELRVKHAA